LRENLSVRSVSYWIVSCSVLTQEYRTLRENLYSIVVEYLFYSYSVLQPKYRTLRENLTNLILFVVVIYCLLLESIGLEVGESVLQLFLHS
jgi:hypothetical protein